MLRRLDTPWIDPGVGPASPIVQES